LDLSAPALLTTALPLISLAYGFLGPRLSAGLPERKPGSLAGVWGVLGALALAGVVGSVAFSTRGHLAVKVDAEQMGNVLPAANCAGEHYPTISITNTGEDPLEFQVSTDTDEVFSLFERQGSLQPGASTVIHLSGNYLGSTVTVTIDSDAGSESVTIVCT